MFALAKESNAYKISKATKLLTAVLLIVLLVSAYNVFGEIVKNLLTAESARNEYWTLLRSI